MSFVLRPSARVKQRVCCHGFCFRASKKKLFGGKSVFHQINSRETWWPSFHLQTEDSTLQHVSPPVGGGGGIWCASSTLAADSDHVCQSMSGLCSWQLGLTFSVGIHVLLPSERQAVPQPPAAEMHS